ncbi:MAG: DUF1573 domain-containing protein [Bacteroidia bacterium]|nr:DUF1573 domain-containing protein [Bacteroidia bacterium]
MKFISGLLAVMLLCSVCFAQTKAPSTPATVNTQTAKPELTFESETFDFGKVNQGEVVKHTFKFKNTGKADLQIQNAQASCGCTVPNWPKDPIKPGGTGTIEVSFNTAGKSNYQNKTVTITSNAEPSTKILYVKGEVVVPAAPSGN